jgi:hypothetical protein
MGFFSWRTMDTDKSISNSYSSRGAFKVDMLDDKGNVWTEPDYEGYGVFGGKDYYELLAEMNGITSDLKGEEYTDYMRDEGISIAFKDNGSGNHTVGVKYPNLVEEAKGWRYNYYGPDSCSDQGYFYNDESDDDSYDEDENY